METELIKRKYRRNARFYDWVCRPTRSQRVEAVRCLALEPGAVVLDLGCGTGLSFELLEAAVGPTGRIIGVEVSAAMLEQAKRRVSRHGWRNVELREVDAREEALQPESLDGVLCFYTHDILGCGGAIGRALAALRVGGRFVAAGVKKAGGLAGFLLNPLTALYSSPFVSSFAGAERPWATLESLLGRLEVSEAAFGTAYIASGTKARPLR